MNPGSRPHRFRGLRHTAVLWGGGGLLLNLTIGLLLFRDAAWALVFAGFGLILGVTMAVVEARMQARSASDATQSDGEGHGQEL